jgi:hypothetical protein
MVEPELAPRKFKPTDAGRGAIVLVLLAVVFATWFFLLPWIQAAILPTAPGGSTGPWVIRPIVAVHFCACAILSAVTLPLLMTRLRIRWNAADAAAGTRFDPFRNRLGGKVGIFVAGGALLLIYAAALLLYLRCWDEVGPAGIQGRMPWGRKCHSFDQITSLKMIPSGMHSDGVARDGPWRRVVFVDGHTFIFGHENEGCSEAEVSAIARFIAERSGHAWRALADAGPHNRPRNQ